MKPILLAALALPVLLTGCATDVGVGFGPTYYDPGYYAYDGGWYGGPYVGGYGYGHGNYYHNYHHYDTGSHNTAFARNSHVGSHTSFAGVSRSSGHASASHTASASVSSGAGHSGGGGGRR